MSREHDCFYYLTNASALNGINGNGEKAQFFEEAGFLPISEVVDIQEDEVTKLKEKIALAEDECMQRHSISTIADAYIRDIPTTLLLAQAKAGAVADFVQRKGTCLMVNDSVIGIGTEKSACTFSRILNKPKQEIYNDLMHLYKDASIRRLPLFFDSTTALCSADGSVEYYRFQLGVGDFAQPNIDTLMENVFNERKNVAGGLGTKALLNGLPTEGRIMDPYDFPLLLIDHYFQHTQHNEEPLYPQRIYASRIPYKQSLLKGISFGVLPQHAKK